MRFTASPLASRTRIMLQVLAMVLIGTWYPGTGTANEATPETQVPVTQSETIISPPVVETPLPIAPTLVPPTVVPTPVPPTLVPASIPPTTVPPTEIPTSVPPTEALVVEPTPTTTPEPASETAEPSATSQAPAHASTPEPTPTSTASTPGTTPTPTPFPNTDALTIQTDVTQIVLAPGDVQEIQLTYAVTTERAATSLHVELRIPDGRLADGWSLMLQPNAATGSPAADLVDTTSLVSGSSFNASLWIQAPTEVDAEQSVMLHISSTETNATGTHDVLTGDMPSATLTLRPLPPVVDETQAQPQGTPEAPDVSLTCATDDATSTVNEPVNVSCSFVATDSQHGREISLSQITVSPPMGWTVTAAGSSSDDALLLEPDVSLEGGEVFGLDFSALPTTCDAEPGFITVRSTIGLEAGAAIEGPATTIDAAILPAPAFLPAIDISSLSFGTSERTDGLYGPVTGTLAITIAGSDTSECGNVASGWSVQVGTSGLSGTNRGDAMIPAESFAYLGSQSVSSVPAGLTPVDADIPLTTGQMTTIAFSDGMPAAGGTWNAVFQLSPPGDIPAGSYEGGIDVVIINGP